MDACATRGNIQLWATRVVAHAFEMICMLCHLFLGSKPFPRPPIAYTTLPAVKVKVELRAA